MTPGRSHRRDTLVAQASGGALFHASHPDRRGPRPATARHALASPDQDHAATCSLRAVITDRLQPVGGTVTRRRLPRQQQAGEQLRGPGDRSHASTGRAAASSKADDHPSTPPAREHARDRPRRPASVHGTQRTLEPRKADLHRPVGPPGPNRPGATRHEQINRRTTSNMRHQAQQLVIPPQPWPGPFRLGSAERTRKTPRTNGRFRQLKEPPATAAIRGLAPPRQGAGGRPGQGTSDTPVAAQAVRVAVWRRAHRHRRVAR